jgi:hypothetical protein
MSTIVTRAGKGSPLTNNEVDANFVNLNTDKLESSTAASTYQTLSGMSSYLTSSTAASTYQTLSGMSSYLTSATAASTYQTLSGMSSYLTSATAASTYLTKASPSYTGTLTGSTGVVNLGSGQLYKAANGKVGLGTASPAVTLSISATDAVLVPVGTTAQRPTGATGYLRYNTTTGGFEGYSALGWGAIGGGGGATGGGTDDVFYENSQTVTTSYTIPAGKNAMSAGPITINAGVTVTVPAGSVWVVV